MDGPLLAAAEAEQVQAVLEHVPVVVPAGRRVGVELDRDDFAGGFGSGRTPRTAPRHLSTPRDQANQFCDWVRARP